MKRLLCTATFFAFGVLAFGSGHRTALDENRAPKTRAIPTLSAAPKFDASSAIAARYPLRGRTSSFYGKSAKPG
jgi:hypothetical protein